MESTFWPTFFVEMPDDSELASSEVTYGGKELAGKSHGQLVTIKLVFRQEPEDTEAAGQIRLITGGTNG
jgi:hypothetical protein